MKNFKIGDSIALQFSSHYKILRIQKITNFTILLESSLILSHDLKPLANVPHGFVCATEVTEEIKKSVKKYKRQMFLNNYLKPEKLHLIENLNDEDLNTMCAIIRRMKNFTAKPKLS
jgi:hypothetical protein